MSFGFDPEVPAGFQDADIEMAELREAANEAEAEQYEECAACNEEKPLEGGKEVTVHTHRVDGQAVGVDTEWVCADCIDEAEDAQVERQLEARQWRGYDRWESEARRGVTPL